MAMARTVKVRAIGQCRRSVRLPASGRPPLPGGVQRVADRRDADRTGRGDHGPVDLPVDERLPDLEPPRVVACDLRLVALEPRCDGAEFGEQLLVGGSGDRPHASGSPPPNAPSMTSPGSAFSSPPSPSNGSLWTPRASSFRS